MPKKNHKLIKRPWGGYAVLEKRRNYWLKKLFVKRGAQLSLQSHKKRYEMWIVLEGKIRAQKGGASFVVRGGEYIKINKNERHRISGLADSVVLEAAFGQPKERDIIRYEDMYGRIK